jgi:8-oxo-dGTP pyrophosphatase MutT (NUDIX family)
MERRRILPPGRPAALRALSRTRHDAAWLRARLSGPDPADHDVSDPAASAAALADDAGLAASTSLTPAAVLVPIVTGPAPGILLTKRAETLRRHSGQVSFPGGRIDPGDASAEAAALRETHEEVGLDPAAIELIGRLRDYVTGTGYRVTPVLGLVAPGYRTVLSRDEVADVFELPFTTLLDPAAPERRSADYNGKLRHYWVWPHPTHFIWGATAAILVHLARRLRAETP